MPPAALITAMCLAEAIGMLGFATFPALSREKRQTAARSGSGSAEPGDEGIYVFALPEG